MLFTTAGLPARPEPPVLMTAKNNVDVVEWHTYSDGGLNIVEYELFARYGLRLLVSRLLFKLIVRIML
jgi:hypothetical protein